MIRLGLRLTVGGGREAAVRLLVTIAAVALGVGLLLVALSGMNAIKAQNARSGWLNASFAPGPVGPEPGLNGAAPAPTADPLWWIFDEDHYAGKTIDRIDVAATGPTSPVPPGIPHLPGPGQYYASPALTRLLHSTPAAELADRYPGTLIGTIGPSALPAPNSLIVVVGHTPRELSANPQASEITHINTDPTVDGPSGWDRNKLQVILAVGALALLFPVLVFIGTATRLAAARREQRFASMRLVGATPHQISVISTVEAVVGAVGGVALGFAVFFLLRPTLTGVSFTGAPFAPGDLSLTPADILLVLFGVPIAAALAARVAMRRVHGSPLGVTRRVTPADPRAYRLVPLLVGIAELVYFVGVGHPKTTGAQIEAYFSGCLLILAGLVIAGPWLTMVGSRVLARRTGRPAVLLAGRRLADNPRAAFRAISGLIIALFATSVSVGVITTVLDYQSTSAGPGASATLLAQFAPFVGSRLATPAGPDAGSAPTIPATLFGQIQSMPGVEGLTLAYQDPDVNSNTGDPGSTVLVSCAELAHTPSIGRCSPGAQVVTVDGNFNNNQPTSRQRSTLAETTWHAASVAPQRLHSLPVRAIVVETDGTRATTERVRTALELAFPATGAVQTLSDIDAQNLRQITELRQMTNVVIVVSLVVAGCSLAVSVTAGVNDRKRPFSLLRLTGVPLRALRQVVALEAAVPLVTISIISAAMGFLAAGLFLRSQLSESLQPPHFSYYAVVAAGLIVSLAIIASTLPIIDRITGPEVARNE